MRMPSIYHSSMPVCLKADGGRVDFSWGKRMAMQTMQNLASWQMLHPEAWHVILLRRSPQIATLSMSVIIFGIQGVHWKRRMVVED